MTIGSILAAEQAAFQNLQIQSGVSAGAMASYWVGNNSQPQNPSGNFFDPYAASRGLAFAIQGYIKNNQAVPSWLMTMAQNYLSFEMSKLLWSQSLAASSGTDSSGYNYVTGDLLITLRDGSVYALQHTYYTNPMNHNGTLNTYAPTGTGAGCYLTAVANAQSLFIQGLPIRKFGSTVISGNPVLPGFVTERGDLSFTIPINQVGSSSNSYVQQQAQAIDSQWTDANDSAGGCMVALAGLWLSQQLPSFIVSWLQTTVNGISNFTALCAMMSCAMYNVDPNTGLPQAAVWALASYTQDSIEVYQGIEQFCYIIRAALQYDPQFASFTDGSGYAPLDQLNVWSQEALTLKQAIWRFCQNQPNTGYAAVPLGQGWNKNSNTQLSNLPPVAQNILEPWTSAFQDDFDYAFPVGQTISNVDQFFFNYMSAMNGGNIFPTTSAWLPAPAGNLTQSGSVVTILSVTNGPLYIGCVLNITGFNSVTITSFGTGTGGTGTYNVSSSQTVSSSTAYTSNAVGPQLGVSQPSLYLYLVAAAYIGKYGAPATLTQFVAFVNAVNTSNLSSNPNRAYTIWWAFDSGALQWLCLTLLSKGAS